VAAGTGRTLGLVLAVIVGTVIVFFGVGYVLGKVLL
jgi:hypothetical protein